MEDDKIYIPDWAWDLIVSYMLYSDEHHQDPIFVLSKEGIYTPEWYATLWPNQVIEEPIRVDLAYNKPIKFVRARIRRNGTIVNISCYAVTRMKFRTDVFELLHSQNRTRTLIYPQNLLILRDENTGRKIIW
jgi:hypothetical protein